MKITGTNRDSKCMYCDSIGYGKSCPYGPNGMHVHVDDGKRCVWCGSTSIGASCAYNPFGKVHQRGITYNPIMVEALETGIVQGILMNKLSKPICETNAFEMGLVDTVGNVIREPDTIVERKALTGVDKYLIKVRNIVKEKLDILNLTLYYEQHDGVETVEDIEQLYPVELLCKDEVNECITKLISLSNSYGKQGISSGKFEQIVTEALMNGKRM